MLDTTTESAAFKGIEVKELQANLIKEHFTPMECCENVEGWEAIFETAIFRVEYDAISPDYLAQLWHYYQLLKKIRQLADYAEFKD
jgi:hypothetical protein